MNGEDFKVDKYMPLEFSMSWYKDRGVSVYLIENLCRKGRLMEVKVKVIAQKFQKKGSEVSGIGLGALQMSQVIQS